MLSMMWNISLYSFAIVSRTIMIQSRFWLFFYLEFVYCYKESSSWNLPPLFLLRYFWHCYHFSQISNPFWYSWQILGSPRLVLSIALRTYQVFQKAVFLEMMTPIPLHNNHQEANSVKSIQLLEPLIIWHLRYFLAWDMVHNLFPYRYSYYVNQLYFLWVIFPCYSSCR